MTQETLHTQTAKLLAVLLENMPPLSAGEMQFLIDTKNRDEVKRRLAFLNPTLRNIVARGYSQFEGEFIELHPGWDFLIMRSTKYPEVGIAVSDRNATCGLGLRLAVRTGERQVERFTAPCMGYANWAAQLMPWYPDVAGNKPVQPYNTPVDHEGIRRIREVCTTHGIDHLLLHGWHSMMKQDVNGLALVDPYDPAQMGMLDQHRFMRSYGQRFYEARGDECESLSRLFKRQ